MVRSAQRQDYLVRVSPRTSLVRNGVLSYALLSLPLFGALYFLTAAKGTWPIALGLHALTLGAAACSYLVYRRTFIGVTSTEVHERGAFGGLKVTALDRITAAVLVSTYRTASTETTEQLMLVDSRQTRLIRMRGVFWTTLSMRAVAAAVRAPLEVTSEPVTAKVFFEQYPGSAYWFENRPALTVATVVVALAIVFVLVLVLMGLMGIRTGYAL